MVGDVPDELRPESQRAQDRQAPQNRPGDPVDRDQRQRDGAQPHQVTGDRDDAGCHDEREIAGKQRSRPIEQKLLQASGLSCPARSGRVIPTHI
jgi:hypothetical protein